MKILLCGGGTGGHITPILAIAHEIKRNQPDSKVIYVGEHQGKFRHLVKNLTSIDEVYSIYGGKLRRYHNESLGKRIFDLKSNYLNIRDVFFVFIGFFQSLYLLERVNPDVIFVKGGYVGVPIGLAAAIKRVPYITHDSDATPSLTTKIIGKWAIFNATGMPEWLYPYPKHKKRFVGVPVTPEFENVSEALKLTYRKDIGVPENCKLLVVTGGSLGAERLNKSISPIIIKLFDQINNLHVVHQVGQNSKLVYRDYHNPHLTVEEFIPNLYKYTGAADVVVTRSGATTIAELAIQGKAVIIIPNPQLTGGQQTKNANLLASKNAAIVITEDEIARDPMVLLTNITKLLNDSEKLMELSRNIRLEAVPDSASKIAMLLLSINKAKK